MSWKEIVSTVLIGIVLSVWISCCAPMEVSAPTLDGPGLEKPGESSLVVFGSGSEIVTVEMQQADGAKRNDVVVAGPAPEENNSDLSPQHSELTGYWYGVGAVLLGQVVILILGGNKDET